MAMQSRIPLLMWEGQDTCRKLCILSSIAFGWHLLPEQVPTTGITSITLADEPMQMPASGGLNFWAGPLPGRMVPSVPMWSPILSVCKIPWPVWTMSLTPFWSKGMPRESGCSMDGGAGKLPTASAVVADVVDALKHGSKVHDSLFWQPAEPVEGMLTDPAPAAYYVRVAGIAPAVVEASTAMAGWWTNATKAALTLWSAPTKRHWPKQPARWKPWAAA